jgi:hypothetical protein
MANSTKISEYSTTAANNTSIDSIDIDENCAASGINNAIRSVLKHQADAFTQGTPIALDQTNNRVGIGTLTPGGSLEVYKAGTSEVLIGTDNGGTAQLSLYEADDGTKEGFLKYDGTNNRIHLATSGAPNALVIPRDSGNVGIGTSSPSSKLDVAVTDTGSIQEGITIKGTQTGGYGGYLGWKDSWSGDAYSGYRGAIIADVPSANAGRMRFFTASGGSLSETMRIDSSGRLAVNTTSPNTSYKTTIQADSTTGALSIDGPSTNGYWAAEWDMPSGSTYGILFKNGGSNVGNIRINASSTSYNTSSDHRLKENVADMTGAIDRVKALAPKRFNFIADADKTVDGFLAHEAQAVVPEAVTGTKDAMRDEEYEVTPAVLDDDGNVVTEAVMGTRSVPDYQGIDQSKLVPLLTGALQEAITKIETLETEMTALKARVTALEA